MNAVAQFIVELTWALTMGIVVAAGILAAKAFGIVCVVAAVVGLVWHWRTRRTRKSRP
jgi:4-amino-4-deoxy-L-arabinose transferase-like glycosyltransferase